MATNNKSNSKRPRLDDDNDNEVGVEDAGIGFIDLPMQLVVRFLPPWIA